MLEFVSRGIGIFKLKKEERGEPLLIFKVDRKSNIIFNKSGEGGSIYLKKHRGKSIS